MKGPELSVRSGRSGKFMARIYVAGPMRFYAEHNFPAFDAAAKELRRAGWEVVSPAELDRLAHVHEFTDPLPPGFLRQAMKRDLASICDCDALCLLPGWEQSAGSQVELTLAKFLGLTIYDTISKAAEQWKVAVE